MDESKIKAGEFYIKAKLESLIKLETEDELMQAGKQLENFLLLAGEETVYAFAIHSWAIVESFFRVGESQFQITEYNELPESMRAIVSLFAVTWTTLFRQSPYPMSLASVHILENSDVKGKMRFAWFTKPVSDFLRRNIMDIAKEHLSKKR